MILKSEIKDASTLSINCAKARVGKGDTVEIADEFWREREVQDAIRLGFVSLVGNPPTLPEKTKKAEVQERKLRFANRTSSKIAFECVVGKNDDGGDKKWIDYVAPGDVVHVPESAMADPQIQNAIGWKMIEPLDGHRDLPKEESSPQATVPEPARLEELTKNDILEDLVPEKRRRRMTKDDVAGRAEPEQPKKDTLGPYVSLLSKKEKRMPSSEEF
jgi:hypothetical protein